jgi:hypothetical protein
LEVHAKLSTFREHEAGGFFDCTGIGGDGEEEDERIRQYFTKWWLHKRIIAGLRRVEKMPSTDKMLSEWEIFRGKVPAVLWSECNFERTLKR